jgi:hypothetical protein
MSQNGNRQPAVPGPGPQEKVEAVARPEAALLGTVPAQVTDAAHAAVLEEVEAGVGKRARRAAGAQGGASMFQHVHQWLELISFVSLIVGGIGTPIAVLEFRDKVSKEAEEKAKAEQQAKVDHDKEVEAKARAEKQQRLDLKDKVYREVDARYMDFVKLCFEQPELDCYSEPISPLPRLTNLQKAKQRMLFTALTDVFEVAYVEYHKDDVEDEECRKFFAGQWDGWDKYIRKYTPRASYQEVWHVVGNEYDPKFQAYMAALMPRDILSSNWAPSEKKQN